MHLTLAFLGELDGAGVEGAIKAARLAVRSVAPDGRTMAFELGTTGLLAFPSRGPASVLAAAAGAGARESGLLALRLERELERVGSETGRPFRPRERRPFSPHVTLARAVRPGVRLSAAELSTPIVASCIVNTLAVFRSGLGPSGARYEVLEAIALRR
jgi:2'-5' RNA ligase